MERRYTISRLRLTAQSKSVVNQRILPRDCSRVEWLGQVFSFAAAERRLFKGICEFQDGDVAVAALANPVLRLQALPEFLSFLWPGCIFELADPTIFEGS